MRCEHCGYWWQEPWEDYPSCHYEGLDEWAPCAQEEEYEDSSYGE